MESKMSENDSLEKRTGQDRRQNERRSGNDRRRISLLDGGDRRVGGRRKEDSDPRIADRREYQE